MNELDQQLLVSALEAAAKAIVITGRSANIISTGISLFPRNGLTVEALFDRADATMYRAKAAVAW